MQLRGLSSSSDEEVELLLVASDPSSFEEVRPELDADYADGAWATLSPDEMRKRLSAGLPPSLDAVLVGVDGADEPALPDFVKLVGAIKRDAGAPVVLLVRDLGPGAMHQLLRAGADDFLPCPPGRGDVASCLKQLRQAAAGAVGPGAGRGGAIVAVYGVAGGVGATTYAVNLSWELAQEGRKAGLRTALVDLDLQYGATSTYLDLQRRDVVYETLAEIMVADASAWDQALTTYGRRLQVLTAPSDSAPVDLLGPDEVSRLLDLATAASDFVIVDLPTVVTPWTETVLRRAESFQVVMTGDMRCANNLLRFLRALRAEEMPMEKVAHVMNRSPGFTDFSGRARISRMAETLGIEYALTLPDGGRDVAMACDQGEPLAEYASGNALRKEIRRAAQAMVKEAVARAESA